MAPSRRLQSDPGESTVTLPRTEKESATEREPLYDVIIVDNDENTYEQVIRVVMEALGCSQAHAYAVAWEVDHTGAAVCATVEHVEAQRIAGVIRKIGIEVRVEPAG